MDIPSVISSPVLADGCSPSGSPTPTLDVDFGPEAAPAHPSAPPAKEKAAPSVRASVLCRALDELATSYAAIAATHGLPMPATYGRSSGDSSPTAVLQSSMGSRLRAMTDVHGSLEYALRWKSWAMLLGPPIIALRGSKRRKSDNGFSGWPTPCAADGSSSRNSTAHRNKLPPTGIHKGDTLTDAVALHGWGTPTSRDHKDGSSIGTVDVNGLLGRQVWAYAAMTESGGALSPAFHLWLQGFPPAWHSSGEAAMQSCRKPQRVSSKRIKVLEVEF